MFYYLLAVKANSITCWQYHVFCLADLLTSPGGWPPSIALDTYRHHLTSFLAKKCDFYDLRQVELIMFSHENSSPPFLSKIFRHNQRRRICAATTTAGTKPSKQLNQNQSISSIIIIRDSLENNRLRYIRFNRF